MIAANLVAGALNDACGKDPATKALKISRESLNSEVKIGNLESPTVTSGRGSMDRLVPHQTTVVPGLVMLYTKTDY